MKWFKNTYWGISNAALRYLACFYLIQRGFHHTFCEIPTYSVILLNADVRRVEGHVGEILCGVEKSERVLSVEKRLWGCFYPFLHSFRDKRI